MKFFLPKDLTFQATNIGENEVGDGTSYVDYVMSQGYNKGTIRKYGTNIYEEELLVFNNILNPYSVKEGQVIKYISPQMIYYLHGFDPLKVNANKALVNKNKKRTRHRHTR